MISASLIARCLDDRFLSKWGSEMGSPLLVGFKWKLAGKLPPERGARSREIPERVVPSSARIFFRGRQGRLREL